MNLGHLDAFTIICNVFPLGKIRQTLDAVSDDMLYQHQTVFWGEKLPPGKGVFYMKAKL